MITIVIMIVIEILFFSLVNLKLVHGVFSWESSLIMVPTCGFWYFPQIGASTLTMLSTDEEYTQDYGIHYILSLDMALLGEVWVMHQYTSRP